MFTAEQLQQFAAAAEPAAVSASSAAPAAAARWPRCCAAPSLPPPSNWPTPIVWCSILLYSTSKATIVLSTRRLWRVGQGAPVDVQSIVSAWQPTLKDSMFCAFVCSDQRVHVQFGMRESMEQALSSVKTLVPCCVTASAWQRTPPCGPLRHDCAERIDIECTYSRADNTRDAKWVADTTKIILSLVAIEETTHWMPSTQKGNRLPLSVLARGSSVAQLTATVQRINSAALKFEGHLYSSTGTECSLTGSLLAVRSVGPSEQRVHRVPRSRTADPVARSHQLCIGH